MNLPYSQRTEEGRQRYIRARNVGAGPARELWVGTTRIIKED